MNYQDGVRLAATYNQYPVVPRIKAFFEPNNRTVVEENREKKVKDTYEIPSEVVPKFCS